MFKPIEIKKIPLTMALDKTSNRFAFFPQFSTKYIMFVGTPAKSLNKILKLYIAENIFMQKYTKKFSVFEQKEACYLTPCVTCIAENWLRVLR